jgi:hypothetical protein
VGLRMIVPQIRMFCHVHPSPGPLPLQPIGTVTVRLSADMAGWPYLPLFWQSLLWA